MLLGRRRRTDIYPDADTFFTARTGRRLWSSRRISEELHRAPAPRSTCRADIPDFLRPLLVWKAAFETTDGDGRAAVRRALRARPARGPARRPAPRARADLRALWRRELPTAVAAWAAANIRGDAGVHLADDPRWARAAAAARHGGRARARRLRGDPRARAGPGEPLDLTPPPARSRLAGLIGRARRRRGSERDVASADATLRSVKARVLIRPKEGILDPQGKAVERALPALGFEGISHVRVGRWSSSRPRTAPTSSASASSCSRTR